MKKEATKTKYVAKKDGFDKERATNPMIYEAGRLYMEMERISQGIFLN